MNPVPTKWQTEANAEAKAPINKRSSNNQTRRASGVSSSFPFFFVLPSGERIVHISLRKHASQSLVLDA
jgi:hypothetical protein